MGRIRGYGALHFNFGFFYRVFVRLFVVLTTFIVFLIPARAGEAYTYQSHAGASTSFTLIGGKYHIYVDAHYVPNFLNKGSCAFAGNLQRTWPTHDAMELGPKIGRVTGAIHYNIGPQTFDLPAGRYALYIAAFTDCHWRFTIVSEPQDAGVEALQMLEWDRAAGAVAPADSTSIGKTVQFMAQYRTDHDANQPASGELQLIHDGKVFETFPVTVAVDPESQANKFYINIDFKPKEDQRYVGKNTAKFNVKIGAAAFTSSVDFTVRP